MNTRIHRRILELQQQRSATDTLSSSKVQRENIKLTWQKKKKFKAPRALYISHCVHGEALYVLCATYGQLFTYTISTSSWSQLSRGPMSDCSTVVINNLLTLVGGRRCDRSGTLSNQLFSLTGEGSGRKWTEEFPPMPTKRAIPISLCTGTSLIVAGGLVFDGYTQTIEVLNSETLQWSTAAYLKNCYIML